MYIVDFEGYLDVTTSMNMHTIDLESAGKIT
jgi:hypothetical protein